jgi:2-dehydropantoate 2-reductase
MEIDPLLTVVQEMGRLVGQATPTIDTVLALIKLRGQMAEPSLQSAGQSTPVAEKPSRTGLAAVASA